jgi:hypothetical protein
MKKSQKNFWRSIDAFFHASHGIFFCEIKKCIEAKHSCPRGAGLIGAFFDAPWSGPPDCAGEVKGDAEAKRVGEVGGAEGDEGEAEEARGRER